MMENYAALLCSWALLCEFADLDPQQGGFIEDLLAEMNSHIVDTDGSRLPWVWIMEILLSELEARRFDYPHCWTGSNSRTAAARWRCSSGPIT
ncbi:hypothetical protein JOS77_13105 [Chromobacterium haemolyticum]|nr:hypothetical protein JOS77_13105 [Chromobacterium haemolyticum]